LLVYILVTDSGKVLLQKRLQPDFLRGKWSLPWDHLQYGDHPDSSARRIVRDQLGIQRPTIRFHAILSYAKAHRMIPTLPEHWDFCFIYKMSASRRMKPNTKLSSTVKYFGVEALPAELGPFQRYIVSKMLG
jgi:ADP-ribose pyrophosphatase YjhB (NUDIX family)